MLSFTLNVTMLKYQMCEICYKFDYFPLDKILILEGRWLNKVFSTLLEHELKYNETANRK